MNDLNRAFVDVANPHSWLLTALNLHEQAVAVHRTSDRGALTQQNMRTGETISRPLSNKTAFLLGAFALENAIKGILVYENACWISNGRLSRNLRSHNLPALQQACRDIPYKNRYRWVLAEFAGGVESWARYPCGLLASDNAEEQLMTPRLWNRYERLMAAYIRALKAKLTAGWEGPHGFRGRWTFSPGF